MSHEAIAGGCSFAHREREHGEPCWGDVQLVGEADTFDGRLWIHACRGHELVALGGEYAALRHAKPKQADVDD